MEKSISKYLDEEYKIYSLYVIEDRAIPSVIDGLKPTQRKIVFVANKIWKTGKEKTLKVFQLGGKVASDAYYHHGDCLDFNTEILKWDGTYIKLGEWVNSKIEELELISYDDEMDKFVKSIGRFPRKGKIEHFEVEIELESGEIIKCTKDHMFLLSDNTWKKAKDLKADDDILDIYTKTNYHHGESQRTKQFKK